MKSKHHPICDFRASKGLVGLVGLCVLTSFGCVPLEPLPEDTDEPDEGGNDTKRATHFEAEDAILFGAVRDEAEGAKGKGMVSFKASGDFVEFEIEVADAATYAFAARYANGSEANTPLQVMVNSKMMQENLALEPTGGWETWQTTKWQMPLHKGNNAVRFVASEDSRGPNFDSLSLQKVAAVADGSAPKDDDDRPDAAAMEADVAPSPMDSKPRMEEPKEPPPPTPICNGVDVFAQKCVACHQADGFGPLDLKAEGPFERIMSTKVVSGSCMGQDQVSTDVDMGGKPKGAFMARLTGTSCGPRMPPGPALSKAEIDCIGAWLSAHLDK